MQKPLESANKMPGFCVGHAGQPVLVLEKLYGLLRYPSSFCLLMATIFLFCFPGYSSGQNQSPPYMKVISFEVRNENLSVALKKLEELSDCKVIFNYDDVNRYKVSVTVKEKTVQEALNAILASIGGNPFSSVFNVNGQITISKRQVRDNSQQNQAAGIVTDKNKNPLPGVTVRVKGTNIGTATKADGTFTVIMPADLQTPVMVFSFIGMKTQEVPYKERDLKVIMEEETVQVDEVVATGIFTKSRESYTGAATTITAVELEEAGNRSLLTSIRNIDPSFNISENITLGSDPNRLPAITVRGMSALSSDVNDIYSENSNLSEANLPLFIMDGFEVPLEKIYDMDESLVESITILKDASSTALYGSRGANGVIVITTKKPQPGKLRFTYKGTLSMELADLSSYKLMNSREKLEYERLAGLYDSPLNPLKEKYLVDLYNNRRFDVERGVDTYWIGYPVRTGIGSRHSVRIDGGESGFQYAIGISYNNVAGAMKGSERNTINGNMFFTYNVKNFKFQNDLQITQMDAKNSPYGSFETFGKVNSYWTPYNTDGELLKVLEDFYWETLYETNKVYNPLYDALLPIKDQNSYTQIRDNFSVEWQPIANELILRGNASVTLKKDRSDYYLPVNHSSFLDYPESDYDRRGTYKYGTGELKGYEANFTAQYNKLLNSLHLISTGLQLNASETKTESYSIKAEGITIPTMDFLGMATQYEEDGYPVGSEGITRRAGGVFNANYTFDRKYFADASGKLDGSSLFGTDKRFASFWSVGAGWNIHYENFMKNNSVIDIVRLRVSYGSSGSQSFSPYQAMTTYKNFMGQNYRGWYGVYIIGMGNTELGWQTTNQLNGGAEFVMLKNRIRLNVDVYNKVTDNLVTDVNLPLSSGFTNYKANIGKLSNNGVETSLTAYPIRNEQGMTWSIGLSLIHNKNRIKEISNFLEALNEEIGSQNNVNPGFLYKEGQSINAIYAVRSKGIDPGSGKEVFVKQDGTETFTWSASDKVACGTLDPKIYGNLTTNLRYKGFTLNLVFSYRFGGQTYNKTLVDKVENISPYENADKRAYYDRWKTPGDVTFFKGITDFTTTYATSRFVMDDNMLKLNSLSLSYELASAQLRRFLPLEYLSLSAYMEDVFHVSSVRQERGLSYPFSRKVSFSLTARF